MEKKNILIIENESNVVDFIKKGLTEFGFEVSVAFDGDAGYTMASENRYSLIILDIMLPKKNGLEVCKELRSNHVGTPILFLTALNTSENISHGLNLGADDYLVKPFKFNELIARINAILRRSALNENAPLTAPNLYTIANLVVNDDMKSVTRNDDLIALTATEYRLLLTLIKNKGRVLSRIDLLESAWDINFDMGTNVVDVYINYLRKKIDSKYEPKLIQTIIGMGYTLREK